jgi:exoribonuclease-2
VNVLYEEQGEFKVGAVLGRTPASVQVESPHGKRLKVKAANVLLEFERPAAAELLPAAEAYAATLDTEFLWQCCGESDFGFMDLAREYVGREPTPVEAAGVLLKLHSAPIYFHRRGRGRYRKAPEETLKLALAGLEKKRRIQETIDAWAARLVRFECPPEVARLREELLYAPDRNKPETKALEQACRETGLDAARLLLRCGVLGSAHEYHLGRFLHEFFPRGTAFPEHEPAVPPEDLPLADVRAFSLDDVGTTEIDDAFSVTPTAGGELRIGIHIAAPALAFGPGSSLDAIARERLSTAYFPGRKFTMLPEDAIAACSLAAGAPRAALSLYVTVSPADWGVRGRTSRIERVPVAANLRHGDYDVLNEAFPANERRGLEFEDELRLLWRFAVAQEARRGRPATPPGVTDYVFRIEGERVRIEPRRRGSPLDKLVSELMILANSFWGELLAGREVAAIYRTQGMGKVRLSVHPEAHEGLGVACYAWFSSPLRRYLDLVNQWQLAAALEGRRPPFARNSEALLSAMRAFEVAAARMEEHQRRLEQYWCLKWLEQERVAEAEATVVREGVARLEAIPLVVRVPSLPPLAAGARVRLAVRGVDPLDLTADCVWRETLAQAA